MDDPGARLKQKAESKDNEMQKALTNMLLIITILALIIVFVGRGDARNYSRITQLALMEKLPIEHARVVHLEFVKLTDYYDARIDEVLIVMFILCIVTLFLSLSRPELGGERSLTRH